MLVLLVLKILLYQQVLESVMKMALITNANVYNLYILFYITSSVNVKHEWGCLCIHIIIFVYTTSFLYYKINKALFYSILFYPSECSNDDDGPMVPGGPTALLGLKHDLILGIVLQSL